MTRRAPEDLARNCFCIFGIRHIHVARQTKESIAVVGPRTDIQSNRRVSDTRHEGLFTAWAQNAVPTLGFDTALMPSENFNAKAGSPAHGKKEDEHSASFKEFHPVDISLFSEKGREEY
ncbi:hypothetical protein ACH518_09155 [Methylomonas sp. HW2-6]|uniref:hypothetical protein n=1 Tax=Methylomonas sp. HW2-6 TaxID=3376687 RepID=UPI004042E3C0